MNKKLRRLLHKILTSALVYIAALALPLPPAGKIALFVIAYFIVGFDILKKSFRNIRNGQIFDENFLMSIATAGAFALREYAEAVAVMLFFQIGEFFQSYAVNQSRKSIADLMDIRPDSANLLKDGKIETVSPEKVSVGDTILVRPGERIPLDGTVSRGSSGIDTSALTGESMPREVETGDTVISGCINLNGLLEIKVTSRYGDSTVAKILDLVENAGTKKADIENFITRFARWYTPAVVIIAALLAVLPPLFSGGGFHTWVYRAITFLVISCPCALVISIPLSFFGGIGAASKCGILIKGSCYLEALADADCIVFDKTGTLTKGNFRVVEINSPTLGSEELLKLAAHAEAHSTHPIAVSIKEAYGKKINLRRIKNLSEARGLGIEAEVDGQHIIVGSNKIMNALGISIPRITKPGTVIFIAVDKDYAGYILIADELKEDAAAALSALKSNGVRQAVMLTGDRRSIGENIGRRLGMDLVYAELLPADKVHKVEELLASPHRRGKLVFVGDGINDAPVLARSDIGIAMGGIGSDAAIEAADIVIMTDEPSKIAAAMRISRQTLKIARENIVFAIGIKLLVLGLGALGLASIWAAVFADVGVSVIAILNAIRALSLSKKC